MLTSYALRHSVPTVPLHSFTLRLSQLSGLRTPGSPGKRLPGPLQLGLGPGLEQAQSSQLLSFQVALRCIVYLSPLAKVLPKVILQLYLLGPSQKIPTAEKLL